MALPFRTKLLLSLLLFLLLAPLQSKAQRVSPLQTIKSHLADSSAIGTVGKMCIPTTIGPPQYQLNKPLFVVDGQLVNENGPNGYSSLNPAEIKAVKFLKGRKAAAIYGSRGAIGGVLIITTKKRIPPKTKQLHADAIKKAGLE